MTLGLKEQYTMMHIDSHTKTILFGADCDLQLHACFHKTTGVLKRTWGYFLDDKTGAAKRGHSSIKAKDCLKVIQLEYDPNRISLEQLIVLFLLSHAKAKKSKKESSLLHRQRPVIYCETNEDKVIAEVIMGQIECFQLKPYDVQLKMIEHFFKGSTQPKVFYQNDLIPITHEKLQPELHA